MVRTDTLYNILCNGYNEEKSRIKGYYGDGMLLFNTVSSGKASDGDV